MSICIENLDRSLHDLIQATLRNKVRYLHLKVYKESSENNIEIYLRESEIFYIRPLDEPLDLKGEIFTHEVASNLQNGAAFTAKILGSCDFEYLISKIKSKE